MEKRLQEIIDRSGLTEDEMFWLFRFVIAAEELFMPWCQRVKETAGRKDADAVKELYEKLREVALKLRAASGNS